LSPCLFSVYLDDLYFKLNNIKAGRHSGKVSLNHLMFTDDICVLSKRTWVAKYTLDACQANAESHGIIFNCSKTVCMTFMANTTKGTVVPMPTLGMQRVKSVSHYKHLGIVLDIEFSDDKDIQRQL